VEEDIAGDSDAEGYFRGGGYGYLDSLVLRRVFGGYGYLDSVIGLGRAGLIFAGASIVFGWMIPDDSS
jgi:hypothetical protein